MIGVVWHGRFLEISFSHPMLGEISKQRLRKFWELIKEEPEIIFIKPEMGKEEDLSLVHTYEYIKKLKEASKDAHIGFLDSGDTVRYPGMFDDILLIMGSSDIAICFSKFFDKIYIPIGGSHHALPNSAMGFCPINDIGIVVKKLKANGVRKIAIVDSDAYHGNGLQYLFYNDKIVKINIFAYNGKFFPRTGKLEERGAGEGYGFNFNLPLPLGTADDGFEEGLKILDILYDYQPEYLLALGGVDGHKEDSLKSLNLSSNSFNLLGYKLHELVRDLHVKVISYGGGGYGEYSAICMLEFIRGLKGIREQKEEKTVDLKKANQVRKIVQSLLVSLPYGFKE